METALPGLRRGVAAPEEEGLWSSLRMVRVGTRSVRRLCAVFGVPTLVRPFSSPEERRASGLVRDAALLYSLKFCPKLYVMTFGKLGGLRTKALGSYVTTWEAFEVWLI